MCCFCWPGFAIALSKFQPKRQCMYNQFNSRVDKRFKFDGGYSMHPPKLRCKGTYAPLLMLLPLHTLEYNAESSTEVLYISQIVKNNICACCLLDPCAHLQLLSHSTPHNQPLHLSCCAKLIDGSSVSTHLNSTCPSWVVLHAWELPSWSLGSA